MKVAEVTYRGRMRSHSRKAPSGKSYRFMNPVDDDPTTVAVDSFEDAQHFEANGSTFDVEYTPQGRVSKMVGDSVSEAGSVLRELSYRQKQRLTSSLDLEVKGNAPEEELNEALEPAVKEMTEQIDNAP